MKKYADPKMTVVFDQALYMLMVCLLFGCGSYIVAPQDDDSSYIVFIGNSVQNYGIDFDELSNDLGVSIENIWSGGALTAWQYASLYRVLRRDTLPSKVILTTSMDLLTAPDRRVEGGYRKAIEEATEGDTVLLGIIDSVLSSVDSNIPSWDFPRSVHQSFLPLMVQEAENAGVGLVFVRSRYRFCPAAPMETVGPWNWSEGFRDFCNDRNIPVFDFTTYPAITCNHFFDDWHYNVLGAGVWTKALYESLHGTSIFRTVPYVDDSIIVPLGVSENDTIEARLLSGSEAEWSWYDTGSIFGEQYAGRGIGSLIVPSGGPVPRDAWVMAYRNGNKYARLVQVVESYKNVPPRVEAGKELTVHIGDTLTLKGTVTDNGDVSSYWTVLQGGAVLVDRDKVVLTQPGISVLSLTADDGEFIRSDILTLMGNGLNVTSPEGSSYVAGDTIWICWVGDMQDALIECSFDEGLTFNIISDVLFPEDTYWGRFPWVAVSGAAGFFRVSTYDRSVSGLSGTFRVKEDL